MRLYENRVETPQGTAYFESEQVTAMADTAGNIARTQRITLTRLVAGGVIGGIIFPKKKVHDDRELYLVVEAQSFSSAIDCKPDKGNAVRQLAVAIGNASKNWPNVKQAREMAIQQAEESLAAVSEQSTVARSSAVERLNSIKASSAQKLEETKKQNIPVPQQEELVSSAVSGEENAD